MKLCLLLLVASSTSTDGFSELLQSGDVALTPHRAVAEAWRAAPEVAIAASAVARAEASVRGARVALFPRLDLSGQVQRIGGFEDGALGPPGGAIAVAIPRTRASLQAALTYPLTRLFAEVLPRLDADEARLDAERHRAEATRERLALAALEAYWRYVEARGTVAVAQASRRQAREQAARVDASSRAGYATQADVSASASRLAAAEQALVRAQGALRAAQATLGLLLSRPADTSFAIASGAGEPPVSGGATVGKSLEVAERARPELLALAATVSALEARRRASWGRGLPQLDLQADATYARPNPNVIPPREAFDPSWGVGAVLRWAPNDLLFAQAEAEAVAADLTEAQAEQARLRRDIQVALEAQAAALESARETWAAARVRVRAASEAYQARRVAFEVGRAVYPDVLEAEAELTRARLSKLEALVAGHVAHARLLHAQGRLREVFDDPR